MKNNHRAFLPVIAVLFFCFTAGYTAAEDSGEQAAVYFQHQQYKEALSIWYKMASTGDATAGTYYNIGLAESLLQNTPAAILAYEKALRLKPGNTLIKHAIEAERKKLENPTIPVEPFFIREWYDRWLTILRPGYWAFLGMGLLMAGIARLLLIMKQKPANGLTFEKWQVILAVSGILALLTGFLSYREIYREDEAIIQVRCEIRQAPADNSPLVRALAPGEKVKITDQIGAWCNVHLLNLDEGWMKKECLLPILIGKE